MRRGIPRTRDGSFSSKAVMVNDCNPSSSLSCVLPGKPVITSYNRQTRDRKGAAGPLSAHARGYGTGIHAVRQVNEGEKDGRKGRKIS